MNSFKISTFNSAPAANQPIGDSMNLSSTNRPRRPLTTTEKLRRRAEGLCAYYEGKGHFAKECSEVRKKAARTVSLTSTQPVPEKESTPEPMSVSSHTSLSARIVDRNLSIFVIHQALTWLELSLVVTHEREDTFAFSQIFVREVKRNQDRPQSLVVDL
jgi:hypothetical protein